MALKARAAWTTGVRPGTELDGPLALVVIHHSYKPALPATASEKQEVDALKSMDRFHKETNGWSGLAYSFCVFQSGRVYECRGWLRAGAHTEGENRRSHGICFVMDGSLLAPTTVAVQAVKDLLSDGVRNGAVSPDYDVQPHDKYKNKVCPGPKIKAILPELLPSGKGGLLKFEDRGPEVIALQKKLGVKPTGYFGPLTLEAVREFQSLNGLQTDGVVGPVTRQKLGL